MALKTMISYKKHFDDALSFIVENQRLVDCHLVDFITEDLWSKCLSDPLKRQLESIDCADKKKGSQQHFKRLSEASPELMNFISHADALSLKNNLSVASFDGGIELEIDSGDTRNIKKLSQDFMSSKKRHEIAVLARLIQQLTEVHETNLVIDAGAGKGYLSTTISENYGIPVLAVDSSISHRKSAIRRQEIINKKNRGDASLVQYSIQHIDEKTDYKQLVQSHFLDWSCKENCLLTGLHTCGHLANSLIKNFLTTDCLKLLCLVPCCYHLTEESLTGLCNFTKNARMLAQQSVERTEMRENEPHPPSLFYRALLQVILQSLGIPDTRIGRGVPTQDFTNYAHWALKKIGVDFERIPSNESLVELYQSHLDSQWKFNVFQTMRVHMGSVIESAIVLDRVLYLQDSDRSSRVALIRLFDPLISPRCYAITASK